ncbi:MAG: flagellar biosynthesis protein FlhF [Desulfatibacillum sp.]|nr:flagellar biosynthesis protein FlhF [Desulfatibacillum sp.]
MRVKRYQANSIKDAMALVKKDLGVDALIVSTKKIPVQDGEWGPGVRERFEVTAIPSQNGNPMPAEHASRETRVEHKRMPDRKRLEVAQGPVEMGRLRELFTLLGHREDTLGMLLTDPAATQVYVGLVRAGISTVWAREWVEQAGRDLSAKGPGQLFNRVVDMALDRFTYSRPFKKTESQVVCAFVGPTGVGKTTTIAKLAADLNLGRKKSVGLLSIDNYRIGAVEQLKTYASILGLPCLQAFNQNDLQYALGRLADKDIVLIDTAGQSQYDTLRMREMEALFDGERRIDIHLVLSAVTCESEMEETAKRFGGLDFSSYVFTKTDETRKRGAIINQVLKRPMPVSFISTGQKVPEDLFRASRESLKELLFSELKDAFEDCPAEGKPGIMGLSV